MILKRLQFLCWLLILCWVSAATGATNNYRQHFIKIILPKIRIANIEVLHTRGELVKLYQIWRSSRTITPIQLRWLQNLATTYRLYKPDFNQRQSWQNLAQRIDALPNSLVLAQAIIESNWGRSRFAREGNNYFGLWCTVKNCGIVPKRRDPGKSHEVQKYNNTQGSVNAYLLNLNSHRSYRLLRTIRARLRRQHKKLTGLKLAHGLQYYSQHRKRYIPMVAKVIRENNLEQYNDTEADPAWFLEI